MLIFERITRPLCHPLTYIEHYQSSSVVAWGHLYVCAQRHLNCSAQGYYPRVSGWVMKAHKLSSPSARSIRVETFWYFWSGGHLRLGESSRTLSKTFSVILMSLSNSLSTKAVIISAIVFSTYVVDDWVGVSDGRVFDGVTPIFITNILRFSSRCIYPSWRRVIPVSWSSRRYDTPINSVVTLTPIQEFTFCHLHILLLPCVDLQYFRI